MVHSANISTPIMPVQNVIQNASLKPGENVIQHAQLFGSFDTTMMQNNRQAINYGETAVGERMYSAREPMTVSNFGTESKIGNGELSRTSRETLETSVEAISGIMQQDDQYQGSKIGDYSALGPTGFQDYNDRSFQSQQQMAAKAYAYFENFG
ncbi:MAG: hypothetical protein IJT73_05465 [Selenomonadaceae bacterium]|nr:hypothetical protein [Selenomonadaceae bacterium]